MPDNTNQTQREMEYLFGDAILIEDDPSHVLLLRRALRWHVKNVRVVGTLAAAEVQLAKSPPDIILCDLLLPDTVGSSHVAELRATNKDTPIIVLTSSSSLEQAVEAMKEGANDFLVKEFGKEFEEVLGLTLSRLATERALALERAAMQRKMIALQNAIENSSDGLAVIDRQGQVLYSNSGYRAFAQICGGVPSSLQSSFGDCVQTKKRLIDSINQNLGTLSIGGSWNCEILISNNKDVAYELNISAFKSGDDPQYVAWVRNIASLKRRERFQREMLSTTTHDLKGPLGTILLSSELLQDMVEPSKTKDLIVRIASSAQGAINLIEEFLSVRKIQEGHLILKPSSQSLRELIESATNDFTAVAKAKNIRINSELEADSQLLVDRLGFHRALGNLLSNACKFTPKNGTITICSEHRDGEVYITVRDTGPGMEAAEVRQLFEKFSRLDKHATVAGTGLGLFVVKSIISAHGGRIEVRSQPGQGTEFTIILPDMPPINERGELISLEF